MGKMGTVMITFFLVVFASLVPADGKPPTWVPTPEERAEYPWIPGPGEVSIGPGHGLSMPLGRILLARKGSEYCAVKFTDTWLGETKYDFYTSYEFSYQGDGSGDFSKGNVQSGAGELVMPSAPRWRWMLDLVPGRKNIIRCGGIQLKWAFIASVICPEDAELAPTPWTAIREVNIRDPRIRWYQKDAIGARTKIEVPIDQLWKDGGRPQITK
jgi:hypothetical protein